MSLNAVQLFVRDQLNGLSSPYLPPLSAYVMPPVAGDTAAPEAFIWATRQDGRRLTMTRGSYTPDLTLISGTGGNRRAEYELSIWVAVSVQVDEPHADESFPLLLQNILKKLWSVKIVAIITDPTTEETSGLTDLGERWSIEYPPPNTITDQRWTMHHALITMHVVENFPG